MINNDYYSQSVHGPYELHDVGNLALEEGGTIRACQLAYAAFGRLNAAKDNAILIPTWYSGTNKIIEQVYIGAGRALDPDRYFIVIVNQIVATTVTLLGDVAAAVATSDPCAPSSLPRSSPGATQGRRPIAGSGLSRLPHP